MEVGVRSVVGFGSVDVGFGVGAGVSVGVGVGLEFSVGVGGVACLVEAT